MGLSLDIVQDWQPQQIHLSYGELPEEIVVTWVTINKTGESIVNYGIHQFESEATSIPFKFIDGGNERRVIWIHKVHIKNLTLGTRYVYRCGSDQGWSEIFSFKAMNEGTDWPIHIALYGDLGVVNPQSLTRLQKETEDGMYDAIIHIGDFAYDMHTDNARMGDSFMKIIEPISAYVPYMVCPGNHEEKYNFSNYRARFSMPFYHENENLFYSWNMGPIHFIAVDTEAYYYLNFGIKPLFSLHNWLLTDLEKATCPEVRAVRPWIILYGHRPMYCSNKNNDDCIHKYNLVRVGLPFMPWLGMEQLLAKYGVDLAIWAHEHSYERLWPVYDYNVLNGSYSQPYTNPKFLFTSSIMSNDDDSSTRTKSVLSISSETRKRQLPFLSLQSQNNDDTGLSQANISSPANSSNQVFLAENLKLTEMGVCYVPVSIEEINEDYERLSVGISENLDSTNRRLDFRHIFTHSEVATVMIVGENIITPGFQRELDKVVDVTLNLKCVCKSSPSYADAFDSDFFIFLVQLDTLESLNNLRKILKQMNQPMSLLCMRSVVVAITSPSGRYNNVIPVEVLHDFLADTQMSSFTYSNENRELRQGCMKRIYEKIKQCCSGNNISLLANWGLTCPVRSNDLLQL